MANQAIGKMDRRVAIQSRTTSRNAYNETVFVYSTFATVWGEKIELTVNEQLLAQQVSADTMIKFRIYYRTDVLSTCRLIVEGQTYEVIGTQELGRHKWTEITVKAVVA